MTPPLNECTVCNQDFASLAAFDEHILSRPSDPFDCLQVEEMRRRGWSQDARGRWTSPKLRAEAERVRDYFKREAA